MTTPDPTLLIRRIADGDDVALLQRYVGFHPRLWRYLQCLLDDIAIVVEEALQRANTLITLHSSLDTASLPPGHTSPAN